MSDLQKKISIDAHSADEKGIGQVQNIDDIHLAETGYKPQLNRNFGLLSVLAIGFGITNTWFGYSGSLVTGVAVGPVIYIWGTVGISLIALCIAGTLGELASAYPNAGGQYYWVMQLAPKSQKRLASYITGVFSWAGAMVTGASVSLVIGQSVVGMYILKNPDTVYDTWMGFVAYQIANVVIFFFNCYDKLLPKFSSISLYTSLISFLAISISCLAASPQKQPAKFVFLGFENSTGWDSNFVAFVTSVIGVAWGFSCLDAATHMAEEIPEPEKNIPKALFGTVIIGFITGFVFSIAVFFSLSSLEDIINTPTYVPSLELYRQALNGSVGGAIVLQTLVTLTACGCKMSIDTWQSRLLWSFARDDGFIFSKKLSTVAKAPIGVPLWAHAFSCFWVAVVGCLYLASSTAFNSMVTGGILCQYISYSIPVGFLWAKRRDIRFGPFRMGKFGWFVNGVVLIWTAFTIVMFSFPFVMPATASTMNYVTVMLGIVLFYAVVWWLVRARKEFKGAREHVEPAMS